ANNRSWDWVAGLDLLEAEARAIPRPQPEPPKRGLFGGKQPPPPPPGYVLDENEIASLTALLRSAGGTAAGKADDSPPSRPFVETPSLDASYRFLMEHPTLTEDEKLI